jgi:hypothetical protein
MVPADSPLEPTLHSLSPETLGALRDVLRVQINESADGTADGSRLRAILRRMCDEAREQSISAERLIIAFKSAWYALPEVQRLRPARQSEQLSTLVTLCIREYYESQ